MASVEVARETQPVRTSGRYYQGREMSIRKDWQLAISDFRFLIAGSEEQSKSPNGNRLVRPAFKQKPLRFRRSGFLSSTLNLSREFLLENCPRLVSRHTITLTRETNLLLVRSFAVTLNPSLFEN